MKKIKKNKIGILGGSFDPAHKGHLKISKEAKKRLDLKKVIWTITKKNPFKKKTFYTLSKRIKLANQLTNKYNFIQIKFLEKKIKSNKTIDLVNFIKKRNKNSELFFLMGADILINFHKWHKWQKILKECNIIVFDRNKYKSKSLKSVAFRKFKNKGLKFINFNKINISSSQLRKI